MAACGSSGFTTPTVRRSPVYARSRPKRQRPDFARLASDRMLMFLLDRTVMRYPGLISPSSFLRLKPYLHDEGYPPDTADCAVYDFDMTAAMIGRWADDRGEEVI